VLSVLRGVGRAKPGVGYYTKVEHKADGWQLHGWASSHAAVLSMVSELQHLTTDYVAVVTKVTVNQALSGITHRNLGVNYEIRLRASKDIQKRGGG